MKRIPLLVVPLVLITALFVSTGRTRTTTTPLEDIIPYDIRITAEPAPTCDPLDVMVVLTTDDLGCTTEQWCVMDGSSVQIVFESFDDLFFRCDGPGCFRLKRIEVKTSSHVTRTSEVKHVCLK